MLFEISPPNLFCISSFAPFLIIILFKNMFSIILTKFFFSKSVNHHKAYLIQIEESFISVEFLRVEQEEERKQ